MPGQLLPLRRILNPLGIVRSLRRALPLQDPSVTSKSHLLTTSRCDSGARSFSSRPARSRVDGGPRDQRRGDLMRGAASAGGRTKSLIDDEAELSDWVSDLKTDSFRLRLSSDSEEEDSDRGRSRSNRGRESDRDMDRDRDRNRHRDRDNRSRGREMERVPPPMMRSRGSPRRQPDSNTDGFLEPSERRKSQSSFGSAARSPRGSLSKKRFGTDSDEEEEEDFSSRQRRGRGNEGGVYSASARKGGRDVGSSYRQDRVAKRPVLAISEDEDEELDSDDDPVSGLEDDFFGDKDDKQERAIKDADENISSPNSIQPAPRSSVGANDSYLSQTRFDQCSLSPLSLKGIKAAGFERMTVVQEATLPIILKGKDVLAKAKTGTGKTVAFLLPAIEVVAKLLPVDRDQKRPINVLVVCPTRELAAQAAAEAETLVKYHPSIGVQVVTGGTRLALEQKRMQTNPCQILVATPGRLRDHLENTPGFATRVMGVKVLVLDEADRLLDMGFRKDIEKIVAAVPRQRQTLLFSATVPEEVRQVCYIAMKRDHEFVNTVEEGSEETHSQVRQMHIVSPLEMHFSMLYSILTEHISEDVDYKVIVFCTTAMVTKLVADLLSELKLNVREIHSRKPQTYRTRVSKEFKESKGLILVSSDVSARGVDYPNVTLVIQVGVPADREQYIHRLGRTGRKGKEGKGVLLLAPWEGYFLDSIKDLPITKAQLPPIDPDTRKRVERALAHVETKNKESAYQAWLGYYNSNKNVARDKCKLVLLANEFSRSMGLDNPPAIPQIVLRKMGLNNVPGLRAK